MSFGMTKCKVTVLKRTLHRDIAEAYIEEAYQDQGPCECFQEGEEFIIDPGALPEEFMARCAWAWADIRQDIMAVAQGADMAGMREAGTAISGCTDWLRPVLFLIERIEDD